jgi:hypothetical protein
MKLPQFVLRDLFWLVLVIALALGWWLDRRQIVADFSDKLAKEGAALRFVAGVMMHQLVGVEGRNVGWSRYEVTIDGKVYSRADWIDPIEAEKTGTSPLLATKRKKSKP